MRCLNCPDNAVEGETGWFHDDGAQDCARPYLPGTGATAEPDPYSSLLGRAVRVNTAGMVRFGVLRSISPGAVVLIMRDGAVTPVPRGNVTGIAELNDPYKMGLCHDGQDKQWKAGS